MNYINILPPDKLITALQSDNAAGRLILVYVDTHSDVLFFLNGRCDPVAVPKPFFSTGGNGVEPDFERVEIIDYGMTVKLGEYECASDIIIDN